MKCHTSARHAGLDPASISSGDSDHEGGPRIKSGVTGKSELSWEAQCALDEAFSDLVCAFNSAVQELLLVPSPDLGALAVKVALAVDEAAWELSEGEEAMAPLKADAARLVSATGFRRDSD